MIKGFRGVSLVDYPGYLSSIVFLSGCNLRCPYCYNLDLVLPEIYTKMKDIPISEIISKLKERLGFVQGIVITGGEPTIWGEKLLDLMRSIRTKTPLKIKLDTNGTNPELLVKVINEDLCDSIALDLKTSKDKYGELLTNGGDPVQVWTAVSSAIKHLSTSSLDWEIRITLYPPLVTPSDLKAMLPYLQSTKRIALQKYIPVQSLNQKTAKTYTTEEYERFYNFLKESLSDKEIIRRF